MLPEAWLKRDRWLIMDVTPIRGTKGEMIMSPRSKKEYIEAIFLRYKKATCKEKTIILDEFCATGGYHRKHAIRLLRRLKRFIKPKTKKRGRSPLYHREVILKPLKQIWLTANLPCSKRLKAILPLWLPGYVQSSPFRGLSGPPEHLCRHDRPSPSSRPNPI